MKKIRIMFLCLLLIAGFITSAPAGYLVSSKGDLPLVSQKISVEINNQVAVTRLEQIFYNPHQSTIHPNIRFPVHEGASVQSFSLTDSDGKIYEGQIEESNRAEQKFNKAKNEGKVAAIAVKKQPGVFETSIGSIAPESRATVVIEYGEILTYKSGQIKYNLPFNISDWQKTSLDQVSVELIIKDQKEITGIDSPSHDIYGEKIEDGGWKATFEKSSFVPQKDFVLTYEVKADEMVTNFLAAKPEAEKDGYFVLMLSPQEIIDQQDIANRDIVFVMDTSGSMGGNKLKQTQEAFNFFVDKLNDEDRFGIVDFSSRVKTWKNELMPVTYENRIKARNYIKRLEARGGTNIYESIHKALDFFESDQERTQTIVFLTDGEASNGIRRTPRIVDDFTASNKLQVRTFTLGVGRGVNKKLLGQLAIENRGEAIYLEPGANLDKQLKGFYQSISTPLLVDLDLDFGNIEVSGIYPKELPNVYKGTQLIVTGRYKNSGETQITLTGKLNSENKEFGINAAFLEQTDQQNRFVPAYWARAKANELLNQIKSYGEKPDLKEEVIRLSKKYQFATPYTSFVTVAKKQVPQIAAKPKTPQRKKSSYQSAAYANIKKQAAKSQKRVVVKKTKAKSVSLWGASGFVPFAVAVPNFRKARGQARVKACYANMRVLLGAVEMYNMDHTDMMTVVTEKEVDILVQEGYLKSRLTHPTNECAYGTIGDLSNSGYICCLEHGTVEDIPEGTKELAIYSDGQGGYTSQLMTKETMPWTTRIWNNYLADILSMVINIPLFVIGLLFSLWLIYQIISLPFKIIGSIFNTADKKE
ncbi:MAG: VIT domain-containing protein [Candidatus Rifleibacteriota bacterium]